LRRRLGKIRLQSARSTDEGRPYGHAKFETLAAFAIAGFLFVTCYQIALIAFRRLSSHDVASPVSTTLTIGVMISTILSNIIVMVYERREGRRLQSAFLIADSAHTRSDIWVSCSVLCGLVLVKPGYAWTDPVISLGGQSLLGGAVIRSLNLPCPIRIREGAVEWMEVRRGIGMSHAGIDLVEVFGDLAPGDQIALRGAKEAATREDQTSDSDDKRRIDLTGKSALRTKRKPLQKKATKKSKDFGGSKSLLSYQLSHFHDESEVSPPGWRRPCISP
jgi:hypothetical protein